MKKFLTISLFLVFILVSLSLARKSISEHKILDRVPMVSQSTPYSCGAAALQAVLGYYGHEYSESELIKELGTEPAFGTKHEKMVEFATKLGIKAVVKHDLNLDALAESIQRDQLAIVEFQAWADEPDHKPWSELWDDGHYAVVLGMDSEKIYFMDPSLLGSKGFIPIKEFLERWHDIVSSGEHKYHTAILFDGIPKPPPAWTAIQ